MDYFLTFVFIKIENFNSYNKITITRNKTKLSNYDFERQV